MTNAIIKRESTQQRIWDLPIRLWHWILTGSLIAAAVIALALGEHSSLFPYHSILGLVMGLMVVLRLIWGVIGTRHARFASLAFSPGALFSYLRGVAFGGAPRFPGHNPGAAYAALVGVPATQGPGMRVVASRLWSSVFSGRPCASEWTPASSSVQLA